MQAASPLAESTDRGTSPIGHHTNNNTVSTATAVSVPHTHSTATSSTSTPSATTPSLSPSLSSSSSPQKRRLTRSPTPFSLQDLEDQEDDEEKFNTTTTTASMFRRNNMYTENTSSLAPVVSLQSIMSQRSTLIRPFGSSSPSSSSSFSTESSNTNNNAFSSFTNHSGQRNYTYLSNSNNNTSGSNDVRGHEGHLSAPKNTTTITSNNSNNNIKSNSNTSNDYKKPTAGWTLFAALAKMSPEEVELIRLTKANTAANKQITTALVSSTTTIDSESVESIPTKPFLKSSPSPKRVRQRRKAMSLSPPSAVSTLSFEMMNDDRQGEGEKKEYQQEDMYSGDNSSPDLMRSPSSPNERGSLSSSSSSSSLSSPPSSSLSSSQSPSPESSPTHRRKRSKIDSPSQPPSALLSRRNKSSSSPKAVQIDESKNIVFSYQAGSTIVSLKSLAAGGLPKNGTEVYGDDEHKMGLVHKNEKNTARNTFDTTASTSSPPSSSSSPSSSPWWSWSSALSSSQSSQSVSLDKISPSPIQSWTPEAPGSLDSTASANGPNTFMNIASSLDRLWSPPMLRRTFSEVSSARRGSRTSASTAAGANESGLPRVPMLRRQASMPSLEREMSDDNPFIDQPAWNPSSSQEQPLQAKAAEASQNKLTSGSVDATPTLPAQEPANTVSNECQEVVMMEAPPMVQIDGPQTSGFTSTTTTTTGSHKNSRGVIRRRDNRQQHHPYRRRALTSTSTSASQSSHGFALPAQLRRAASFSGSTNTPAQPVLRREMSTTAYMDIM